MRTITNIMLCIELRKLNYILTLSLELVHCKIRGKSKSVGINLIGIMNQKTMHSILSKAD